MKRVSLAVLLLASSLTLVGCGESKSDPAAYNKCLETEAAKLLDETGSNLDYANEMAAKACADLQSVYLPALHFSEQYFTFSQSRAHFLRHSKGRLQRWQILGGKPFLVLACIGRGYSELPWKIFFSRFKNLVEFAKLFLIERTPRK